jgi:hypothetical protein
MNTKKTHVGMLTCRWGKPCTWTVKPKIVAALPANVEPMTTSDVHHMRKLHHLATMRAVLAAA